VCANHELAALQGHAAQIQSLSVYDTQVLGQAHALIGQIPKQLGETRSPAAGRKRAGKKALRGKRS
jgi:hypothetical protein